MTKIPFSIYEEAKGLLMEGNLAELKKLLVNAIKEIDDEAQLQSIMDSLKEPVMREHLNTWAQSKSLPPALVDHIITKLLKTNMLTIEQKMLFAENMAKGKYYLDFGGMLKASEGSKVDPSKFFKIDPTVAAFIMSETKDDKSSSLLAAPTNIGKGEVAFVILGGLGKPSKGDLEYGSAMIEVKEGAGAAMAPKAMVHPTKFLKDMQDLCKSKLPAPVFKKLPTQLGKAGNSLAYMLSITDKHGFPFGQFCKENNVPVKVCKEIMQAYIDKVYSFRFNIAKYIKNDYSCDVKGFGKDSFVAMFAQYQKEYGFSHLMYFFSGAKKTMPFIYSMKSSKDASSLFDKVGMTIFSGADEFGRAYGFGGTYHVPSMKTNL